MTEPAEGIAITRVFDAPRERVFAAWTEPAQFAAWFGGTEQEVPLETVSLNVRPGGTWTLQLLTGDGELHFFGEYVEIDPPSRLVMTFTDERPDDARELLTVTFADLEGKAELVFTQTGGHLTPEQYRFAGQGWRSFFDTLAAVVAG